MIYVVLGLVCFSLSWKLWAWYAHYSSLNRISQPLIFHHGWFHLVTFALVLILFVLSCALLYQYNPWLAIAPFALTLILMWRMRKRNTTQGMQLMATVVALYAQGIKNGMSKQAAKQYAVNRVEGRDESSGMSDDRDYSLGIHIGAMLEMRGLIPSYRSYEDFEKHGKQSDEIQRIINMLLEANGLDPEEHK